MKPLKSVGMSLLAATVIGVPLSAIPVNAWAETSIVQQNAVAKGVVKSTTGEPLMGAVVFVVGTKNSTMTDVDGRFTLKGVKPGATIRVSLMGYKTLNQKWTGAPLTFSMEEIENSLNEVVVTAMGIVRKEKSLTYATQQIKADDIMKVQDANLINSIEGKISGVTITPSAGGAGGASKIQLRGAKSILGNNAPLIVVDGIPMTNGTRGQISDPAQLTYSSNGEGSDPLSMINPDDIESMNILKGANAAALYGSAAANGVVMITTKKGKEGRMDINFNSNVTFDTPLLTPEIQNLYGTVREQKVPNSDNILQVMKMDSWGNRLSGQPNYTLDVAGDKKYFEEGYMNTVRLRNHGKDDIKDFYETGYNTNNSLSIAGGTEKLRSYVSFSNSHSNGMIETNSYNRNTFAFRQSYKLWNRVTIDASANYVQTKTKNRVSGGTIGNPIYDLYTMPRDVDMDYYKHNYVADGAWKSSGDAEGSGTQMYYTKNPETGAYEEQFGNVILHGPMQQWAYQNPGMNNPYWLIHQNNNAIREDRFFANFQGKVDIYDGLSFQARVSIDQTKYNAEFKTYATNWGPADMNRYGTYALDHSRTSEIYTDYLLSYNKNIQDWSVSATAGWVGHTIKGHSTNTYTNATVDMSKNGILTAIPNVVNYFEPSAGGPGVTSKGKSSNWDKAALFTAQIGWKDKVFVDGSYRRDWYRPFKQLAFQGGDDNFGYFGFGANAILTSLMELPKWVSYAKYRLSYSEVGNSIPNVVFNQVQNNLVTGTTTSSSYNSFSPIPEKTKSFETGLEMQFFNNRLNADITYYNTAMHNSYLTIPGKNGKIQAVNTGVIRNQGIEMTVGYDWRITNDWRWKTSVNFSYNKNKIVDTYKDDKGYSKEMASTIANGKVQILYKKGGEYGDMYVNDFNRWGADVYKDANGKLNVEGNGDLVHKKGDVYIVAATGKPGFGGNTVSVNERGAIVTTKGSKFAKYVGNMNSNTQLSWANTFFYKNFSLYFLINGRIGGKVVSLTEGYLDKLGVSKRTGDARAYAEANNLYTQKGKLGMYINEGRDLVAVEDYYTAVGSSDASSYVYDATNFRLRELSLGYTFRDLLGENKNLSISVIGRNLFFLYKDSPVDPDISLSTANGLGGFDVFNMPSPRSFGVNLKLNF